MDIVYGISAGFVLIVGLLRVFNFEKGAPFYAQNWFFWTKMDWFRLGGFALHLPDHSIRFVE